MLYFLCSLFLQGEPAAAGRDSDSGVAAGWVLCHQVPLLLFHVMTGLESRLSWIIVAFQAHYMLGVMGGCDSVGKGKLFASRAQRHRFLFSCVSAPVSGT